jgi:transcriptional regulator with PAS, ATPase and Fis domain
VASLVKYRWPGNIRQLRNIAEQISVLEASRLINDQTLHSYLPNAQNSQLPALISSEKKTSDFSNEREILYKVLFDMKGDLNDLKKLTLELLKGKDGADIQKENDGLIRKIYGKESQKKEDLNALATYEEDQNHYEEAEETTYKAGPNKSMLAIKEASSAEDENRAKDKYHFAEEIQEEETLSLHDKEIELIIKSLERNKGKRKLAASELGISERTLYRKIKQYNL